MGEQRPTPHGTFEAWRPDEVAECLTVSDELYRRLWSLVPRYDAALTAAVDRGEGPIEPDVYCLSRWWSEFTYDECAQLNMAAFDEFGGE